MIKQTLIFCIVTLVLTAHSLWAESPEPEKEARALMAAEAWLSIVDKGEYDKSWEKTSEYFQNSVSKKDWTDALTGFRKPFGKVILRKVAQMKYTTSLPGAPDGEYVVIHFKTSFKNKASSFETVTPSLEKNGTWRVAGYFIK
ncbi:MAG: DUF4019 domain-containing protein [Desulfobacterales bacterium]|nr:DUF4019 domain-containing protein [Desulfobacterales bacterium]